MLCAVTEATRAAAARREEKRLIEGVVRARAGMDVGVVML